MTFLQRSFFYLAFADFAHTQEITIIKGKFALEFVNIEYPEYRRSEDEGAGEVNCHTPWETEGAVKHSCLPKSLTFKNLSNLRRGRQAGLFQGNSAPRFGPRHRWRIIR